MTDPAVTIETPWLSTSHTMSRRRCTEGDPDSKFPAPLSHGVRHHAVNPDRREHEADETETSGDPCQEPLRAKSQRDGVQKGFRPCGDDIRIDLAHRPVDLQLQPCAVAAPAHQCHRGRETRIDGLRDGKIHVRVSEAIDQAR